MKRNTKDERDLQALDRHRTEIDSIDSQILSLLSRRQDIAAAIGQFKRDLGLEIFDPDREAEVLRGLASRGQGNLTKEAIRHIFGEIISAARSVQGPFTVAFLGPEATFSHQAAISLFGRGASFRAAESIERVFDLVEKGMCQQGVVPIENSYEGSVNSTLDLLYQYSLRICAEFFLRIRHHLLSKAEHTKEIKRLYSHPMAIAQCRSWIKENMDGINISEVESTSLAAKMAAGDSTTAAVGSRLCALTYGLHVLEEGIEDHPDNVTRFLAIGKTETQPTSRDKTSLLFFVEHKPGALHRALEALAKRSINLTRIESRPMRIRNWEYMFFVDLEGHEQDGNLSEPINEMGKNCQFMKRLGSYPAGSDPWE